MPGNKLIYHSFFFMYIYCLSDDRSADVFRKILESSTEMQSVLTSSSKPNCLIIDEIDGAPAVSPSNLHTHTLHTYSLLSGCYQCTG